MKRYIPTVRYVSPIICSLGRLPGCEPECPWYFPLSDDLEEAKRKVLGFRANPPDIGTCPLDAELILNRYPDRDRNERDYTFLELKRMLPLIVDTHTWDVVPFNDEDLNPELYE